MLFCSLGTDHPELRTSCSARASTAWPYLFRKTCLIYGLELLALVLYLAGRAASLRGACCRTYIFNNNCLAALVRGGSNTSVIAVLVARFCQLVQRFDICALFPRVHSDINPADFPGCIMRRPCIFSLEATRAASISPVHLFFSLIRRRVALAPRCSPLLTGATLIVVCTPFCLRSVNPARYASARALSAGSLLGSSWNLALLGPRWHTLASVAPPCIPRIC